MFLRCVSKQCDVHVRACTVKPNPRAIHDTRLLICLTLAAPLRLPPAAPTLLHQFGVEESADINSRTVLETSDLFDGMHAHADLTHKNKNGQDFMRITQAGGSF